jgi:uncharacterized membrane protein YoaK (UPF0700 family)
VSRGVFERGFMFRSQGAERSAVHNALLAGYLACVGGFVNSAGLVLVGIFTSHVTGNVGRLANDIVSRQLLAAGAALSLILAFYLGALLASSFIESQLFSRKPTAYAVALACEAVLLLAFSLVASREIGTHARLRDMEALLLCAAMGMQNSLVTRLSGAVVRTTHLTGVVTDLGIETARWIFWWHGALAHKRGSGRPSFERPIVAKIRLHLTIVTTFTFGAVLGCSLSLVWHQRAMLLPSAAVALAACYALVNASHAPLRASQRRSSRPPTSVG